MTIVKDFKEYEIGGVHYFVEKYADKPDFVWFWRYGVFTDYEHRMVRTIKTLALAS